jgi:hypothetical protein
MHFSSPRKIFLALAVVASALALAACGGGDDTSSTSDVSSTPEGTTEAFLTAIANGDGEAACALASEDALKTIEDQEGSCEDAVTSSAGDVSDEDKQDVADATFEVTDETDTTATVTATKPDGQAQSFDLVLEDGEWKLNE